MAEPVKLSIAIVNWNAGHYLIDCLASVFERSTRCSFDVWLADNASTDGSAAEALACYPQIKAILNPDNPGFASANNQILQVCTGKYVLLLNPDTLLQPGAVQTLVNYLEVHPQVGACGPRLSNPDGSLQVSCFPFPTLVRELWRLLHLDAIHPLGVYPVTRWSQDGPHCVDSIQGACLLLRRSALNQVGDLDPGYFMYTEEIDLCYRLKQAGWPLFWIPAAEVIHYGGRSTAQVPDNMFLRLYHSKVRFFRRRYGRFQAVLYKSVLFLASLFRLALTPLTLFERRDRKARHLHLARQYSQLLWALPGY